MTVTDARHALGRSAETAVATWLETVGWRVLARRHRSPSGGEVDLIALDPSGVLVGVEVRARRTQRTGAPAATVDRRRVGRVERTLAAYAAACQLRHRGLRVDLVAVEPAPGAGGRRWRLRRIAGIGGW